MKQLTHLVLRLLRAEFRGMEQEERVVNLLQSDRGRRRES
jgi:hypothetical protein